MNNRINSALLNLEKQKQQHLQSVAQLSKSIETRSQWLKLFHKEYWERRQLKNELAQLELCKLKIEKGDKHMLFIFED